MQVIFVHGIEYGITGHDRTDVNQYFRASETTDHAIDYKS